MTPTILDIHKFEVFSTSSLTLLSKEPFSDVTVPFNMLKKGSLQINQVRSLPSVCISTVRFNSTATFRDFRLRILSDNITFNLYAPCVGSI